MCISQSDIIFLCGTFCIYNVPLITSEWKSEPAHKGCSVGDFTLLGELHLHTPRLWMILHLWLPIRYEHRTGDHFPDVPFPSVSHPSFWPKLLLYGFLRFSKKMKHSYGRFCDLANVLVEAVFGEKGEIVEPSPMLLKHL